MAENLYIVGEKQLTRLLKSATKLDILESGGVDNWTWYMGNREEYIAEYLDIAIEDVYENDYDIDDIVKDDLKHFKAYNGDLKE